MSLILTEEQELLKDSAASFVADNWQIGELRKMRNRNDGPGYDADLWRQMAALGWAAIPFPETCGGLGLGYAELGVVLEELGRELVVAPLLSSVVLGGGTVDLAGSAGQKQALLPGVCDGSRLLSLAYHETPRHDT